MPLYVMAKNIYAPSSIDTLYKTFNTHNNMTLENKINTTHLLSRRAFLAGTTATVAGIRCNNDSNTSRTDQQTNTEPTHHLMINSENDPYPYKAKALAQARKTLSNPTLIYLLNKSLETGVNKNNDTYIKVNSWRFIYIDGDETVGIDLDENKQLKTVKTPNDHYTTFPPIRNWNVSFNDLGRIVADYQATYKKGSIPGLFNIEMNNETLTVWKVPAQIEGISPLIINAQTGEFVNAPELLRGLSPLIINAQTGELDDVTPKRPNIIHVGNGVLQDHYLRIEAQTYNVELELSPNPSLYTINPNLKIQYTITNQTEQPLEIYLIKSFLFGEHTDEPLQIVMYREDYETVINQFLDPDKIFKPPVDTTVDEQGREYFEFSTITTLAPGVSMPLNISTGGRNITNIDKVQMSISHSATQNASVFTDYLSSQKILDQKLNLEHR